MNNTITHSLVCGHCKEITQITTIRIEQTTDDGRHEATVRCPACGKLNGIWKNSQTDLSLFTIIPKGEKLP